jgi:Mg-chelatase subunit ChlD
MKICSNCGASNPDSALTCDSCGTVLGSAASVKSISINAASFASKSMASKISEIDSKRKADIMFVLDCTGSMQGEIDGIKEAITSFADAIESDGVRARVGLVEFRDRLIGEEHRVLKFDGQVFTNNPSSFRKEVSPLKASGGGDEPESSLDALMLALRQPFNAEGNKVIVLITDASPHIPDQETSSIETVTNEIKRVGINQMYLVIRTMQSNCQVYLKLLEGVRGQAFEIGKGDDFRSRTEDFKRTLMALGKTISAATR